MTAPHHRHSGSRSELHGSRAPLPRPNPNPYDLHKEPSPPYTAMSSDCAADQFEIPPAKRQRLSASHAATTTTDNDPHSRHPGTSDSASDATTARKPGPFSRDGPAGGFSRDTGPDNLTRPMPLVPLVSAMTKSRRVRTGCLTCRTRHLKCDEAMPDCLNCRKSNRECKRGVRLNFIDVQVKDPPHVPPTLEWSVQFQDESRLIASEYRGGLGRYAPFDQLDMTPPRETDLDAVLFRQQRTADNPEFAPSFSAGSRGNNPPGSQGMFYPGSGRPGHGEHLGYSEVHGAHMRDMQSRRDGDVFLATGQQAPPAHHTTTAPGSFSLAALQERPPLKDDGLQRTHAYKTSDVSSATSTLVSRSTSNFPSNLAPGPLHGTHEALITPPSDKAPGEREYLTSDEEILYMQVFVNEVAIWMDSFDKDKHFSRVIPYLALKSPMLLNAFLACGVKHLTQVDTTYGDDKALFYYDTATTQLLRNLQNPDRNMAECATTAVVLNVYEIMSEKPAQRMSHIAGARALIRECGWDARSPGIGAACFWLNIGMEVLSCLSFNWQTAWDPDQWGIDLEFTKWGANGGDDDEERQRRAESDAGGSGNLGGNQDYIDSNSVGGGGKEEVWVHRIFYIVAKIANFRANIPRFQEPSPHDEQIRHQSRFAAWKRLKAMCDSWDANCPRPMRPFGYASKSSSKSRFPKIWLIKRAAVLGRLFYHTALCLLAQMNPVSPRDSEENRATQIYHAHQVCGIVAHTRDKGVSSVAIRSLAIASAVLTDRDEQNEVVAIFDRVSTDTGWRLDKVVAGVKKGWGWEETSPPMLAPVGPGAFAAQAQAHGQRYPPTTSPAISTGPSSYTTMQSQPSAKSQNGMVMAASSASLVAPAPTAHRPVNPLLVQADFSLPNHPYQNWYEPPNRANTYSSPRFWPASLLSGKHRDSDNG